MRPAYEQMPVLHAAPSEICHGPRLGFPKLPLITTTGLKLLDLTFVANNFKVIII